jgi:hypothetical protein
MSYEYRVIPAPVKGTKTKSAKTAPDRFAVTLQEAMNSMAADGWEFLRAETLPSEERSGLTGTKTVYHNMLVFRRLREADLAAFAPKVMTPPAEPAATSEPAATFIRPSLSAVSEPSGKAPPVLSPRALSGTLVKDSPDASRDKD